MKEMEDALRQRRVSADRLFLGVLWTLVLFSICLSGWYDTIRLALLVGIPVVLVPTLLILKRPGALLTRLSVAIALMVLCAMNIHQARGMPETHFGIFVLLAFLLYYQDWRVIVTAAVAAAIHHLSFGYLQAWGYDVFCFTHPGFGIVLVHAGYLVVQAAVLSCLAVVMSRETASAAQDRLALQTASDETRAAVTRLRSDIEEITRASQGIATSSSNLSERTALQASSVQDTYRSIGELATTVQQTAENARQAHGLVQSASSVALQGGDVVAQVVGNMSAIRDSSYRITDIIGVIDSIAFQTNILALNAAVEAARAGDQGRGFAVVATEVRALAQRSAAAAREIGTLITESVTKVDAGWTMADEAGRTMQAIVESVRRVTTIMADIAEANQEQSAGIAQMNGAIAQVEEVTRQNSLLVDQTSTSAAALHHHIVDALRAVDSLSQLRESRPAPKASRQRQTPLVLHAVG